MNILRAWKDSLSIFAPKNFKLFALVTLKSIVDTYKIMFRYWWWLYALSIGVIFFESSMPQQVIAGLMDGFLCFFALLAVRSSVRMKNYHYFAKYLVSFLYVVLAMAVWYLFVFMTGVSISKVTDLVGISGFADFFFIKPVFIWVIFLFLLPSFIMPILPFFILFFIDMGGDIHKIGSALIKAIKMTIYNYPLCLLVSGIFGFINFLSWQPMFNIPYQYTETAWLIAAPIVLSIWANIYIKKIHEQSDLYFKES